MCVNIILNSKYYNSIRSYREIIAVEHYRNFSGSNFHAQVCPFYEHSLLSLVPDGDYANVNHSMPPPKRH